MINKHCIIKQERLRWGITIFLCINILLSGCAPKKEKIYRVGILCGANSLLATIDGFKEKMGEIGYVEGQNIFYEIHKTNNNPVEEQHAINRFIDTKVDLIFAFPNETAITAKHLTQDTEIPVIFAYSAIEGTNLVKNLRHPGDNMTGVRYPIREITGKRLELLLELDPEIKRIWLPYNPDSPLIANALFILRLSAYSRGISLVEVPISTVDEIRTDLTTRDKKADFGADAMMMMPDLITQSAAGWNLINQFAEKYQLPIAAVFYDQLFKGALFHYGLDYPLIGRTAAILADKILKGTSAGTIPVISPEEYLRINLVRASILGLTVPDGLLKQADEIIH